MKVLIIKPSSLGDVVHSLRIAYLLTQEIPKIEIHWVIKSGLEGILDASGIISRNYIFYRGGGFFKFLKLCKAVRKEKYDYALDMQGLLRSAVLTKIARSEKKFGRADGREFSTFFYKCIGEKSREKVIHAIDRLLPFVELFGIKYCKSLPLKFPNSQILEGSNLSSIQRSPYILIFPESRRPEKEWPNFEDLVNLINRKFNLNVVIAGSVRSDNFQNCIDVRGKVKLVELPWLIKNSLIVISNDSAPLHIASSLCKPLVALFGPTEHERYGPYPQDGHAKVIASTSRKIEDISTESVYRTIETTLTEIKVQS